MPEQEPHIFENDRTLYETGSNKRVTFANHSVFVAVSDMLGAIFILRKDIEHRVGWVVQKMAIFPYFMY